MTVRRPHGPENIDSVLFKSPEPLVTPVRGGLTVISRDGESLGRVGEIVIDAAGALSSFLVRSDSDGGRDMRIQRNWIRTAGRSEIHLHLSAAEVRSADPARRSACHKHESDMPARSP